jgi:hypothetical protein
MIEEKWPDLNTLWANAVKNGTQHTTDGFPSVHVHGIGDFCCIANQAGDSARFSHDSEGRQFTFRGVMFTYAGEAPAKATDEAQDDALRVEAHQWLHQQPEYMPTSVEHDNPEYTSLEELDEAQGWVDEHLKGWSHPNKMITWVPINAQ